MALLTIEDLREHIDTALGNNALQRLMDANEAAIVNRAGPLGVPVTQVVNQNGYESIIFLTRALQVLDSPPSPVIIEGFGFTDARTLESDDYRMIGKTVRRIDFGANPGFYFLTPIQITGIPEDDTDERIRVLIELCQLDINFKPGLASFTTGKHSETYSRQGNTGGNTYLADREALLDSLVHPPLFG